MTNKQDDVVIDYTYHVLKYMTIDGVLYTVDTVTGELEEVPVADYIEPINKVKIDCKEALKEYANSIGVKANNALQIDLPTIKQSKYETQVLMLVKDLSHLNIMFVHKDVLYDLFKTNDKSLKRVLGVLIKEGILLHYNKKEAVAKNEYKLVFNPFVAFKGNKEKALEAMLSPYKVTNQDLTELVTEPLSSKESIALQKKAVEHVEACKSYMQQHIESMGIPHFFADAGLTDIDEFEDAYSLKRMLNHKYGADKALYTLLNCNDAEFSLLHKGVLTVDDLVVQH